MEEEEHDLKHKKIQLHGFSHFVKLRTLKEIIVIKNYYDYSKNFRSSINLNDFDCEKYTYPVLAKFAQ